MHKKYYLNQVKTTTMDASDGQDFVYGFTNRTAMHSQKSLDQARNTNYLSERKTLRKAAEHFMPDFKRPNEPLLWEKQLFWQTQIEDEDNVPNYTSHHSTDVTLEKILDNSKMTVNFQGKPVFPWTEVRDVSDKMPIKSFDDQKEWKRYVLYHSQHYDMPEMVELRRKQADRVARLDKEASEFTELQKAVADSKIIEGQDEMADELASQLDFVIENIEEEFDGDQKSGKSSSAKKVKITKSAEETELAKETFDQLFTQEEQKLWGREETADQLLERYTSEKTDFNYDLLYQVWRPQNKKDAQDVWALTNMRILNLNIEGAKGTLKKRNEEAGSYRYYPKAIIAKMDREVDEFFEPYVKRQRELRIMMNNIYRSKGKKAPYIVT